MKQCIIYFYTVQGQNPLSIMLCHRDTIKKNWSSSGWKEGHLPFPLSSKLPDLTLPSLASGHKTEPCMYVLCTVHSIKNSVVIYSMYTFKNHFQILGIFKQKENFSLHFVCNLYDTKNYVTPLSGSPILFNETQLLKTFSQKQLEVWSWACIQISNIDLFYSILKLLRQRTKVFQMLYNYCRHA